MGLYSVSDKQVADLPEQSKLGDVLVQHKAGTIKVEKSDSKLSVWQLTQNLESKNLAVRFFAQVCAKLFAGTKVKMSKVETPLENRDIRVVKDDNLAGRGEVWVDERGCHKKNLNSVEFNFFKDVHDSESHPLKKFLPAVKEVGIDPVHGQKVLMENIQDGVSNKDSNLMDIKIGRHIANKEELLLHDYQGKSKLKLGWKMFRMGVMELLTKSRTRGYTFIPQTKNRLERLNLGKDSEGQIGGRLRGRDLDSLKSVRNQLQEMSRAVEKSPYAFIGSSVLIAFPDSGEPRVKLIDFTHTMNHDEVQWNKNDEGSMSKENFYKCKRDFLFGLDNLAKLVDTEISERESNFNRGVDADLLAEAIDVDDMLKDDVRSSPVSPGKVNIGGLEINRSMLPQVGKNDEISEDVKNFAKEKINKGLDLIFQIMQDGGPQEVTKDRVMSVLWALHALAEQKAGKAWDQGAMTISDPEGRLANFLNRCDGSYGRISTHFKKFSDQRGQVGLDGEHYGLDITGKYNSQTRQGWEETRGKAGIGSTGMLPNGMRTCLFFSLHPDEVSDDNHLLNERMTYIKFEEYSPEKFGHWLTTARSALQQLGIVAQPEDSRKERVPSEVSTGFSELKSSARKNKDTEGLARLEELGKFGIRGMYRAVSELRAKRLENDGVMSTIALDDSVKPEEDYHKRQDDFIKMIEENEVYSTNTELRRGKEVIFNRGDLVGMIAQMKQKLQ